MKTYNFNEVYTEVKKAKVGLLRVILKDIFNNDDDFLNLKKLDKKSLTSEISYKLGEIYNDKIKYESADMIHNQIMQILKEEK